MVCRRHGRSNCTLCAPRSTNIAKAEAARDDGMARAEQNAHDRWKQLALEGVYEIALGQQRLVTDDVWRYLADNHPDVTTHEHRAMGPLMRRACKAGWVRITEDIRLSERPECHRQVMRVYDSLVFGAVKELSPRAKVS